MSDRKADTMKVSGGEYAKVPVRLKLFREDCPNGLIETTPNIQENGEILFKARVLKDKSDPNSAEATGHALGANKGVKAFEKLETVAIGRALAILGYLASGEIASSEEMELFKEYQDDQAQMAVDALNAAETIDELKSIFMSLGTMMSNSKVVETKNAKKLELSDANN